MCERFHNTWPAEFTNKLSLETAKKALLKILGCMRQLCSETMYFMIIFNIDSREISHTLNMVILTWIYHNDWYIYIKPLQNILYNFKFTKKKKTLL